MKRSTNGERCRPDSGGESTHTEGSGYEAVDILGKLLNFDQNMSPFRNEACGFCHMPYAGFSGPIPSVNLTMIAYPGTFHYRAGKRTAQRYTYSPDFPVLEYNYNAGAFFGGNFWDGHSTGYNCRVPTPSGPHPPVDTRKWVFLTRLASRFGYRKRCTVRSLSWSGVRISTSVGRQHREDLRQPGRRGKVGGSATPIPLSAEDRTKANNIYDIGGSPSPNTNAQTVLSPFTSNSTSSWRGNTP